MTNINIITRQIQLSNLGMSDLPEVAANLILSQPHLVAEREESRVRAVRDILTMTVTEDMGEEARILLLVAELIGTGGHNGLGSNFGGETNRLPIFAQLGSGRRRATDGATWDRAIKTALQREMRDYVRSEKPAHLDDTECHLKMEVVNGELLLTVTDRNHSEAAVEYLLGSLPSEYSNILANHHRLGTISTMRALIGQLLIALTREQDFIALTHNDTDSGRAVAGIRIDQSCRTPEGKVIIGEAFWRWDFESKRSARDGDKYIGYLSGNN